VTGPASATGTYFEDVAVGDTSETPSMTVTGAHVGLYCGVSGEPTPPVATVPDLLPLCLSTGLGWRVPGRSPVVLAFVSIEWHFVGAVQVGDTIRLRSRISTKRSLRDSGVIVEDHELVDQRGTVAQRGRFTFLVAKRPSA
jgi:acyl dehydratase